MLAWIWTHKEFVSVTQLNSHSKEDQKTRIKMRLSLKLLILFVIFVACFELSNAKRGGGGRGKMNLFVLFKCCMHFDRFHDFLMCTYKQNLNVKFFYGSGF